jgi:hypothetical protein
VNDGSKPVASKLLCKREVMKQSTVVSLDEYRACRLNRAKRLSLAAVGKPLPGADRLWELLDRNISLSVWKKGN